MTVGRSAYGSRILRYKGGCGGRIGRSKVRIDTLFACEEMNDGKV